MSAYILRRLLLIIPTLFGIMLVNFVLTQFVPGGPIEAVIARVEQGEGAGDNVTGGADAGQQFDDGADERYQGARGLSPEFLAQLEVQMGFARVICEEGYTPRNGEEITHRDLSAEECSKVDIGMFERFFILMGQYVTFDFGESYFKSKSVVSLVIEKMPVSITLGLWSTLIAYLISIPLGIRKAVRDGSRFDTWSSGVIVAAYAIPGFIFAILLLVLFAGGSYWKIFPLRGLTSPNAIWEDLSLWGKALDYLWHIFLPVLASSIAGFASLTLLTKNSFLDEIKKQYVITARAKGLSERKVLYGHVFRNAMLIVIAGFPGAFLGVFFGSSLVIEWLFSLDGLGRLGFESVVDRDYPVVFGTLFVFGLIGLLVNILSDLMYVFVDPRIDFERRAG
ncbi:MAG: ABC transporter permease subunit [Vannielia sp.]|uniref:microcin C ABC transporter permease YejB n=1 Tax=Rhodobacterales TaxID=204455 RepID=UPI002094FAA5|nr:ABC transporter permease subunit [Oceanicola sp. 502str15]MCO6384540.1 ABC transporter permease subunit [Oceanicola sp. 502str15]